MSLRCEKYVVPFKNVQGKDYRTAVIKYTRPNTGPAKQTRIVMGLHAVSTHKEQWLPVFERLFASEDLNIKEAWSFDAANHAESLVLNKEWIEKDPVALSDLTTVGQALLSILESGLIDYHNHELIAVGHSAGANAVVRAAMAYILDKKQLPFKTAILVEPVFLNYKESQILLRYKPSAETRKWQWLSREEAEEYLRETHPWKKWHPEIRKLYVEYGMTHTWKGTELKTPPQFEAACYPNAEANDQGRRWFPTVCEHVQVHIVFGGRVDFVPQAHQDGLYEVAKKHNSLVTVQRVKGGGHMLVQERPDGLSEAITAVLRGTSSVPAIPQNKL
ncbi:hypothetical protein K474DRAFT_1338216 [Panus rudis PR-1116 ss-1]|nr:hypothetical protein K474DRAFT_1338216 [Panus rudis PR-1116 ss-1]